MFGYFIYLMIIFGVVKVVGVCVLLIFGLFFFKEWVFVGFIFDLLGVLVLYVFVGYSFLEIMMFFVLLGMFGGLYWFCLVSCRLDRKLMMVDVNVMG